MKQCIKVILVIVVIFTLSGCGTGSLQNALKSFDDSRVKLQSDSSLIVYSSDINDAPGTMGKGTLILENTSTGKEISLPMSSNRYSMLPIHIKPGTYRLKKWLYDACFVVGTGGSYCKEWRDFGGVNQPVSINKTFIAKQGEVLYMGNISIQTKDKILSILNHGTKDIPVFKKRYTALKSTKIKNISSSLSVRGWKFIITGAGFFK